LLPSCCARLDTPRFCTLNRRQSFFVFFFFFFVFVFPALSFVQQHCIEAAAAAEASNKEREREIQRDLDTDTRGKERIPTYTKTTSRTMTAAFAASAPTAGVETEKEAGVEKPRRTTNETNTKTNTKTKTNKTEPRDVLERIFEWGESAFCGAPRSIESLAKEVVVEPDVLDYVFDNVESFTCSTTEASSLPDSSLDGGFGFGGSGGVYARPVVATSKEPYDGPFLEINKDHIGVHHHNTRETLERENSIIDYDPNGSPARLATTRNGNHKRIARLGQEGDLLDYCFESVESCVCSEGKEVCLEAGNNTNNNTKNKTAMVHHNTNTTGATKGSGAGGASPKCSPTRYATRNAATATPVSPYRSPWYASPSPGYRRRASPETNHPIPRVISTTSRNHASTKKKKKKRRVRRQQNYYPDEEDNILLYYRPMKH